MLLQSRTVGILGDLIEDGGDLSMKDEEGHISLCRLFTTSTTLKEET